MEQIIVHHNDGQYPIYIGEGLLEQPSLLSPHLAHHRVMIVTNETVAPLYLEPLIKGLRSWHCDYMILPDGELYKTFASVQNILDDLISKDHHRDTTVIALGGGVVSDTAGFAAACFHRGVAFIPIPTTLLAQADASIGGKTAINHPQGKNLIGFFHQPQAVIIDINTLNTLPERQFRSGIAEIIKIALIIDEAFFRYLEENFTQILNRHLPTLLIVLKRACQIKCHIVEQDLTERHLRALLNFGHTFGHAIERYFHYNEWLHGEAVAMGMILAADLSKQFLGLPICEFERIFNLIKQIGLPTELPTTLDPTQLITMMYKDKKILANQLRLVLLPKIGQATIHSVEENTILQEIITKYCVRSV